MREFRFFDPTVINEALLNELQHPSGTMDDPLTAAIAHDIQPPPAEASSEYLTPDDGPSDARPWADYLIAGIALFAAVLGLAGIFR
jgi:hypothetical protein